MKHSLAFAIAALLLHSNLAFCKTTKPKPIGEGLLHKSSFTENWSRYPSPDSILLRFQEMLPVDNMYYLPDDCARISDSNIATLGGSLPSTGKPVASSPGDGFFNWYARCLASYILQSPHSPVIYETKEEPNGDSTYVLIANPLEKIELFWGAAVVQACGQKSNDAIVLDDKITRCTWRSLSPSDKLGFARYVILNVIGPDELVSELGVAPSAEALALQMIGEVDKYDQNPSDKFNFLFVDHNGDPNESEEWSPATKTDPLKVSVARGILYFLINIKDSLKY